MNEITKLYKNAGIEVPIARLKTLKDDNGKIYTQPPFTAEKQILLIQWLLDRADIYLHRHKTDFTYSIATGNISVNKNKDFKESIAEFINAIWQSLTLEEKQQVKGILE